VAAASDVPALYVLAFPWCSWPSWLGSESRSGRSCDACKRN